jgi:signal transduction histidine kinase/GAF domain-containing protein
MNAITSGQHEGTFGTAEWNRFLGLLRDLSGFDLSFFDPTGKRMGHTPASEPICRVIERSDQGRTMCEQCWKTRIFDAENNGIQAVKCSAEMTNLVARVAVGTRLFGYLVGAQVRVQMPDSEAQARQNLGMLAKTLGTSPDDLITAYQQSASVSTAQLEKRRKTCERLVHALTELLADAWLERILDRVQGATSHSTREEFWSLLGESTALLVGAQDVEIIAVAPAMDVFARVWPESGKPALVPTPESLACADRDGYLHSEESRRLIVPIRVQRMGQASASVVALLSVESSPKSRFGDVDIRQLTRLAETAGTVLAAVRTRESQKTTATLLAKLRSEQDHRQRLKAILEACAHLVHCTTGDVALLVSHSSEYLRTVVRCGKKTEALPFLVAADQGITGRVMQTKTTAVVPSTRVDPDFQDALSPDGRLATRYKKASWKTYQQFLRNNVASCVTLPLILSDELLGVMSLHRDTKGPFDLDAVHDVETLAGLASLEAHCLVAVEHSQRHEILAQRPDSPDHLAARFTRQAPTTALESLGKELAQRVRELGNAFRVAVRIVNQDRDALNMVALATERSVSSDPKKWKKEYRQPLPLGRESPATYAFNTQDKLVHVMEDTAQQGTHYHQFEAGVRSHLSIVLATGLERLGVVSIDWTTTGVLNAALIRRLQDVTLRYAAAMKLSNVDGSFAALNNYLEEQKRKQEGIDYNKALGIVAQMLGATHGAVFLRRPSTGRYHLAAHLTHPEWQSDEVFYQLGEGLTGWVAQNNRPVRISNQNDPMELAHISPDLKWASKYSDYDGDPKNLAYLAVPISVGSEILGVLRLVLPERGHFGPNDEQIAVAAAMRIAGFLYQQDEAARTRASMTLSSTVARQIPLKEATSYIFEALNAGIGKSSCHLRLLDRIELKDGNAVEVLGRFAVSDPEWEGLPVFRRMGEGIAGRVWETKEPFVYQDVKQEEWITDVVKEDLNTKILSDQVGSGMCVPIFVHERFIGTLHVHKTQRQAFSGREIAYVEEIASIAGPSIDRIDKSERFGLQAKLERLIDRFLSSLLVHGTSVFEQENELLKGVCDALLDGFGSEQGWVRVLSDDKETFTTLHSRGIETRKVPNLKKARIFQGKNKMPFLAVSEPGEDMRISIFSGCSSDAYRNAVDDARGCSFLMGEQDEPLAVFTVLLRQSDWISYSRAEAAASLLRDLAKLVRLGRQFERTTRDIEVTRPLVLLGTLFSSLQHETRSPVANLKGAIDLLTARPRSHEEMQEILGVMASERDKLKQCLEHMTALVGVARNQQKRIDLRDTLSSVINSVSSHGPSQLVFAELPERPIWVKGVGDHLKTAFQMVMRNAVEAVEQKGTAGRVRVGVLVSSKKSCSITIEDNGPGMSRELQRRALEPYFTTKPTGSGLGLPAAYCIVRYHDGDLTFRSQEGEGTTVIVTLPVITGDS